MTLSVDKFKSKLTGGGARANLFRVTLNFPAFINVDRELASFMVKASKHPSSQLSEVSVPFRGRVVPLAGDRTFEDWEVTVYNDTNFAVRNAFERWSNEINKHAANTGLTSPDSYTADMLVEQLTKDEKIVKTYRFKAAWPLTISEIELNSDSAEAIEEFTVTFKYLYWTSDTTDTF